MHRYHQDNEQVTDGVSLLISILVRYPEIGTVNYDPASNTIKLAFMLSALPAEKDFTTTKKLIFDSLAAYHMLEGLKVATVNIQLSLCEQVAMLTLVRDVNTLTKGEITLVISLLKDCCKEFLIADCNDAMLEEDLEVQEELIEDMLENVKKQDAGHGLIGIREDGRVLVFNK